jgi:peptide-methionine (S)-S-oxide reductase
MHKPTIASMLALSALLLSGCFGTTDTASAPITGTKPTSQSAAATTQSDDATTTRPDTIEEKQPMANVETGTFGAGCFWCVESVLLRIKGVESVTSGYMGGHVKDPTYEAVCSGQTGHAEVVQVKIDPNEISFDQLLDIFWQLHDPTTLNRQGPDVGTQYRSAVFYHSDKQRETAESSKAKWDESGKLDGPIVTEISPATEYFAAEAYHQDFFNKNPGNSYCRANILPKFKKLGLLKESDVSR